MSGEDHPFLVFVVLLAMSVNILVGLNLGLMFHDILIEIIRVDSKKLPSYIIKMIVTLGLGFITVISAGKSIFGLIKGKK